MRDEQIARIQEEWSRVAKGPVTVTTTPDWIYAHSDSELAVLRIYYHLRGNGRIERRRLGEWVFFKELKLTGAERNG